MQKARTQLESPQRSPVRIPKRVRSSTPFEEGDVIVHTTVRGKRFVLWVSEIVDYKGGDRETAAELVQIDPDLVTERPGAILETTVPTRLNAHGQPFTIADGYLICSCQNWPLDRYSVVGNVPRPADRPFHSWVVESAPSSRQQEWDLDHALERDSEDTT